MALSEAQERLGALAKSRFHAAFASATLIIQSESPSTQLSLVDQINFQQTIRINCLGTNGLSRPYLTLSYSSKGFPALAVF